MSEKNDWNAILLATEPDRRGEKKIKKDLTSFGELGGRWFTEKMFLCKYSYPIKYTTVAGIDMALDE